MSEEKRLGNLTLSRNRETRTRDSIAVREGFHGSSKRAFRIRNLSSFSAQPGHGGPQDPRTKHTRLVARDMSSTSKLARPVPFTPKRNLSLATGDDDTSRLPRSTTPSLLGSAKRYKAPLSTESRTRLASRPGIPGSVPATPSRSKSRDGTRPKTPSSPRKGTESPLLMPHVSEMDVSRVDPEEALVDFETVDEAGDISADIDEALLRADYGKEDKVLVSIR